MNITVSPDKRADILRYASGILPPDDREDPVKVAAAALPLLEWAEQAADEEDLRARMRAMFRQHCNTANSDGRSPGQFVDEAGTLYAFLAAGRGGR